MLNKKNILSFLSLFGIIVLILSCMSCEENNEKGKTNTRFMHYQKEYSRLIIYNPDSALNLIENGLKEFDDGFERGMLFFWMGSYYTFHAYSIDGNEYMKGIECFRASIPYFKKNKFYYTSAFTFIVHYLSKIDSLSEKEILVCRKGINEDLFIDDVVGYRLLAKTQFYLNYPRDSVIYNIDMAIKKATHSKYCNDICLKNLKEEKNKYILYFDSIIQSKK